MADQDEIRASVQHSLEKVVALLHQHELVESLVHRQEGPRQELVETLVHKLHLVELQKLLDSLHPADVGGTWGTEMIILDYLAAEEE